ncbi:hypothetical protein EZS27_006282 [termite gut metagenome]|uniref:Uncharacterized protein n=1 Tax=termite gut metagenome TaxID=433724 RepID=A0A5J4SIY3_9ZZZZ
MLLGVHFRTVKCMHIILNAKLGNDIFKDVFLIINAIQGCL